MLQIEETAESGGLLLPFACWHCFAFAPAGLALYFASAVFAAARSADWV